MSSSSHLRALTLLSVLVRVLVAALVVSSTCLLDLFDASPRLVLGDTTPPWISSLLRWDAFHFLHVALKGHVYEHSWAFFPALPFLMRLSGRLAQALPGFVTPVDDGAAAALLGGAVLAALLDLDSTRVLYRLSLHHLRSPSAAFLATALSLLSSSPATLRFAPYSEPLFTYCSYRGMWACACARWASASAWFALAGAFRSNGVFLAGFVLWGVLVEPWLSRRTITPSGVLYCIALVALPLVPFVHHNYTGYLRFCTSEAGRRPGWCDGGLYPSIYAHVQREYWNVGFLRYWTLSNVPNVVLALPVLANVSAFGAFYLARYPVWSACMLGRAGEECDDARSLFLAPSILPHVLHALALTTVLVFNAHVQIALRVLPSHPVLYWAAAWLVIEHPGWGRAWVAWSIVWGAVSCVLWAVFLPPA